MRSLRSPSAPADGHVARWHGLLLLSALIGALMTVGTSIVLRMLLSPATALSGHQPGPTLVGYFMVVVAGIWAGRVALKVRDRRHAALLVVGLGVTTSSLWLVVEPHYSMRDVFATMGARPGIPAGSFVLWLWGVGSFVWGARRGLDLSRLRPNSARDTAGGILVIAGVSTLQASFASAQSGLSTASWALPTSVLLAGATLAAAEFERTRELTRSQGFAPPSWGRWARLVAGLGVGAAAVAGISFALLGRGALQQLGHGLLAAWKNEAAFREELLLAAVAIPLAIFLGRTGVDRALLIGSIIVILIVEILNSAVEAVVDKASPEKHELAKRAKDMGSAAVLLSLINAAFVWACVLWPGSR